MCRLFASTGAIIILLLTTARAGDPSANYYPIELGNEWTYRLTANNKNSTVVTRIAKFDDVNGTLSGKVESPNVNASEHVSQTAKGIVRTRFNGADVNPPLRLLPYPAKVGDKWDGQFAMDKSSGAHKYTGEVVKEENVKVPMGTFKALRVLIKLQQNDNVVATTYWFVNDVGFVKQSVDAPGVSIVLELEKFEKKK